MFVFIVFGCNQSYNVVITTFDIVALEYSDETDENREEMRKHYGCGLQYVNWLRVVLDEAGKIMFDSTPGNHLQFTEQQLFGWLDKYLYTA